MAGGVGGYRACMADVRTDRRTERDDHEIQRLASERSRSHAGLLGFVAGAVLAVAAALLIIQNRANVEMSWLMFDVGWPLWVFLLLSFAAGAVAAPLLLAAWMHHRDVRAERRRVVGRRS